MKSNKFFKQLLKSNTSFINSLVQINFMTDSFDVDSIKFINPIIRNHTCGGVAQMVERALSMREVPGSMPGTSTFYY